MLRGAKLRLADVDPGLVEEAMRPGQRLIARVRLTDARGNPGWRGGAGAHESSRR